MRRNHTYGEPYSYQLPGTTEICLLNYSLRNDVCCNIVAVHLGIRFGKNGSFHRGFRNECDDRRSSLFHGGGSSN